MHGAWCAWHAAFHILVFTVRSFSLHTDGRITYSHERKNATQLRTATHTQQARRLGAGWRWGGRRMRMCMHRDRMAARKEAAGSAAQPR